MKTFFYKNFGQNIHNQGFYACNRESDEYPLMINITGQMFRPTFNEDSIATRKDFYLLFLINGNLKIHLSQGEKIVGPNTLLIFPPQHQYHYEYFNRDVPLLYLYVHFTGSYADRLLQEIGLFATPCIRELSSATGEKAKSIFNLIFSEFEKKTKLQQQLLSCLLEQLLLTMAQDDNQTTDGFPVLQKSIHYIHHHYQRKISIPELAKMENICNSRYLAIFRSSYGMPPSKYLIKVRMDNACDLLINTELNINEIGEQVGYPDTCFFCKVFKKMFGVSPKNFRENTRHFRLNFLPSET